MNLFDYRWLGIADMMESLRYFIIISEGLTDVPSDVPIRLFNVPYAAVPAYTPLNWDSGSLAFTIYGLH